MPLLTELFILFGFIYKDAAPTALKAAFSGIQERAGQKLERKIQSQRLMRQAVEQAVHYLYLLDGYEMRPLQARV